MTASQTPLFHNTEAPPREIFINNQDPAENDQHIVTMTDLTQNLD